MQVHVLLIIEDGDIAAGDWSVHLSETGVHQRLHQFAREHWARLGGTPLPEDPEAVVGAFFAQEDERIDGWRWYATFVETPVGAGCER
jgi:hypothetical protein